MYCDAFWLPKSVDAYANTIQMPTQHVHLSADNTSVGVRQWAVETMAIWQEKGGLTTQWKDNIVREHVWVLAQSMNIRNKRCAGCEKRDLLIDHCITTISDLEFTRPLWKLNMADKTILSGQKLEAVLVMSTEVGLC